MDTFCWFSASRDFVVPSSQLWRSNIWIIIKLWKEKMKICLVEYFLEEVLWVLRVVDTHSTSAPLLWTEAWSQVCVLLKSSSLVLCGLMVRLKPLGARPLRCRQTLQRSCQPWCCQVWGCLAGEIWLNMKMEHFFWSADNKINISWE